MQLLFVSSPVGALGSGIAGGVELTLANAAQELRRRGHGVTIVAPAGSVVAGVTLVEISGNLQNSAQTQDAPSAISLPLNSVLANMWEYVRSTHQQYDLVVNFAYDWLPFYLTPFLSCPVAHLVSMGSLSMAMDQIIISTARKFSGTIAFHTQAQAATFDLADLAATCPSVGNGIDISLYNFCPTPRHQLAWVGRISPEKALEDAVAAAAIAQIPLKIMGMLQDQDYWQAIQQQYPQADITYLGFLNTQELQQELRQSLALLVTPRWIEAFGNVAIEAMACGVPVIAYARGGLTEIIDHGKTGFLTTPDQISELVIAINQVGQLDRYACRQKVEQTYSLAAQGDRLEQWFQQILHH
jgi:UDP-glucose:tetrahydrobiopterin glucosyltransferase